MDPNNDTYDRRLARHMISLYFKKPEEDDADLLVSKLDIIQNYNFSFGRFIVYFYSETTINSIYEIISVQDMSVLRDYVSYAKENIHPRLSDEASQRFIQAYVEMRKVGSGRGQITAYPRQLESLIRLAEAHAKVRLSQIVEVVDVEESWRLHREAVKQSATDPVTGKVDQSIITTGVSDTDRKRRLQLSGALKRLINSKGRSLALNYQKVYAELKEQSAWVSVRDKIICKEMSYLHFRNDTHTKKITCIA